MSLYLSLIFFRLGLFYLPREEESKTSPGSWRWLCKASFGTFCLRVLGCTLLIDKGRWPLAVSFYTYPAVRIDWTLLKRSVPRRGPKTSPEQGDQRG